MIIGIMGQARVGKDTMALHLQEKHNFVRIGLADPMKRFCAEVFEFSDEQLYGNKRDEEDKRYFRKHAGLIEKEDRRFLSSLTKVLGETKGEPTEKELSEIYLTPRYALQTLGTEWGRDCYQNVWIDYGIRVAKTLLDGYSRYDVRTGLEITEKDTGICPGVVFSDIRFRNEFDAMKKAGAIMVKIVRPGNDGGVGISGHPSEEEQKSIALEEFDHVITNDGTLEQFYETIDFVFTKMLKTG